MPSLKRAYRPTPWLLEGVTHTVYAMRFRPVPALQITREILPLPDGGTVALEILTDTISAAPGPFVVIIPTMYGSSRDKCVANLAAACARRGWGVAIASGRGAAGVKFTSPRLTFFYDYDFPDAAVGFIRTKFKPTTLFMAGFSMGAMQTVMFNCFGEHRVDGVAAISHMHDNWECRKALARPVVHAVFTKGLVSAMTRMAAKNPCIPPEDKHFRGVVSPPTFDEVVGHKYRGDGPRTAEQAFSVPNIYDKIRDVRAPTLLIASHDDPMTLERLLPITEVRASERVALVHTREGGHVGFLTGLAGRESIVDTIVPDFFNAILRNQ